jgi:nitroreductase
VSESQILNAVDVILGRVSPIRLAAPGPSASETDLIVAAGLRAPDHGQLRPWKFLVIRGDARESFGQLLGESLRRRQPEASDEAVRMEAAKAMRAPLLIVAAVTPRDSPKVPGIEQIAATAAAIENMLIAAHALGFGGFWRTGPAAYDSALTRGLGFAQADQILGFVYVGSIAMPGKPKQPQPEGVVNVWTGLRAE